MSPLYNPTDWERREPETSKESYRTDARRDSARLLHSAAFRRLQGKTQLYPGAESDFFRNRLTHSLEVGQIAKSIAIRLNATEPFLEERRIDPDLCEFAGWCHDLGHPPFGHTGERALHERMKKEGGFEGNAQALRIVARLEKRRKATDDDTGFDEDGKDHRLGLNLTARSLAAVLKYDNQIPARREGASFSKGFYRTESDVVRWIKQHVAGRVRGLALKTIECAIMDLADDIAYSTYDLEDSLKAGFLTPSDILSTPDDDLQLTAKRVRESIEDFGPDDVLGVLHQIFRREIKPSAGTHLEVIRASHQAGVKLATDGYHRSAFTSDLVAEFIRGIQFLGNEESPAQSRVSFEYSVLEKVEVLKNLTFVTQIESPKLEAVRFRGVEIIDTIFEAIEKRPALLPQDFRDVYERRVRAEASGHLRLYRRND